MNDFKNQSPWGSPPGGNGNGDGGFRRGPTPPNVDEIVKNLQNKIKKNFEISALIVLIFFTVTFTSYFNIKKNLNDKTYNNFIDNIYFKKTLNDILSKTFLIKI